MIIAMGKPLIFYIQIYVEENINAMAVVNMSLLPIKPSFGRFHLFEAPGRAGI